MPLWHDAVVDRIEKCIRTGDSMEFAEVTFFVLRLLKTLRSFAFSASSGSLSQWRVLGWCMVVQSGWGSGRGWGDSSKVLLSEEVVGMG